MSYQALYRKFRPAEFDEVKGQEHIVTTLQNQIKNNRIGHAYLFCGTRGTGKTTIAKIFAKAVNCENPVDGSPCGECETCKRIANGSSMNVIEIDAASNNGVDHIREIVEEVSYSPAEGKYKVYIIDEVHMLSIGAFNALLKTLEEPPSYVIFILATTESHKIPITILSRCQRYDFKRIGIDTITNRLQDLMERESLSVEPKALRYVAKAADGSMRDALSLLEQCLAFHYGETLTYEMALDVLGAVDQSVFSKLLRLVLDQNISGAIALLDEAIMQGREMSQFVVDFVWYLRNLMLVSTNDDVEEFLDISADNLAMMKEEAGLVDMDTIMWYIRVFSELSDKLRHTSNKRIFIEMTLIKLCRPAMDQNDDSTKARIKALEQQIEKGIVVQAGSASAVQGQNADSGPKKELPKAVPDDIKQVVSRWSGLIGEALQPMKMYMQQANLSLAEDGSLLVVLPDGSASDYFIEHEDNRQKLKEMIALQVEKDVAITFRSLQETESFEQNYVDLSQIIQFDIEEIDSEEETE